MIEVMELLKDNAITVQFKGGAASMTKRGLYRFDADRGNVRVYEGEISLTFGEQTIIARKGKEVAVGDGLQATNFDPKDTDPFYRWAERRSEYIATANVSAARQAGSMGLLANTGSWAYNPYLRNVHLPSQRGITVTARSDRAYYSPLTVGNYYAYNYGNYGGYYNNVGTGTRVASAPSTSAPTQRGVDTVSSSSSSSLSSGAGRASSSGGGMSSVASHGSSGGGGGHK